ncbi:MAG: extracellular solute-binding protein, partial [Desulfobacterales bacterium]|nr:extracellular solute-binding protein [Desulfobacterales bacterium]
AFFAVTLSRPESASSASFKEEMIAKAKKEGELVLVGSVVEDIRQGIPTFRKRYPFIKIKAIEMNTKSTVNRVSLEAKAGRLTIDWTDISEDGAELFVRQGLNAKYDFPHLKDYYPKTQPPHGLWVGGMANPRVQGAYNTNLIKPEDVPKSWEEMTDIKWKGKTMLSSSAEDIPGRLAWMFHDKDGKWGWDRAFDIFTKLKAQNPIIARGFSGGNQQVAAGEVAIFWFTPASPGAMLALTKGAPMGLIAFPKFFGGFRAWSVHKDAPHPASAWLLTDYLTSAEGQSEITEIGGEAGGFLPLNQKAKPGRLIQWVMKQGGTVENMIPIDLANLKEIYAPENQEKSEKFFFKLMGLR